MNVRFKPLPLLAIAILAGLLFLAFAGDMNAISQRIDHVLASRNGSKTSTGFIDARALLADPKIGQLVSNNPIGKDNPALRKLALPATDDPEVTELVQLLASAESRIPGSPGYEAVSFALIRMFNEIFGPSNVHVEEFPVTVPVNVYTRLIFPASGKRLADKLHPLWPFGVKLQSFAGGAADGLVVDGGNGSLKELDGKTIRDSIVLMSFDSNDAYLQARQLGAKAVILLSRGEISYHQSLQKFSNAPIDAPLFFADPPATAALLEAAQRGEHLRIETHSEWREVTARNIWARFPGAAGDVPLKGMKWTKPKWDQNNLLINAFYDSMSIVPDHAQSASTSAGLISLVSSARYMRKMRDMEQPNQHGVVFLANGAHYLSHLGISHFSLKHALHELHPLHENILPQDQIDPRLMLSLEMTDADAQVLASSIGSALSEAPWYNVQAERDGTYRWMQRVFVTLNGLSQAIYANDRERIIDGIKPPTRSCRSMIPVENDLSFDSDVTNYLNYPAVPLTTADDPRSRVDTPGDSFAHLNVKNVQEQVRTLAPTIYALSRESRAFEDMVYNGVRWARGGSLEGRAAWYDIKSSFSAPIGRIGEGGLAVLKSANSRIPTHAGVRVDTIQRLQFNNPKGGDEHIGYEARISSQKGWRLFLTKTRLGSLPYVSAEEINKLPLEVRYIARNGSEASARFEGSRSEYLAELPGDLREIKEVVLCSKKGTRDLFSGIPLHDEILRNEHFELSVAPLHYASLEAWSDQFTTHELLTASMTIRGPQELARKLSYDQSASQRRGRPTYSVLLDSQALGVRDVQSQSADGRHKILFSNIRFQDRFSFPTILQGGGGDPRPTVECYRTNYDGAIDYATDMGQQGSQSYSNQVPVISTSTNEMLVVLFPCRAVSLFDTVDSRYLRALDVMQVLSPDDSEPVHYGQYSALKQSLDERYVPLATTAFVEPKAPLKILMSTDFFGLKYLLVNTPENLINSAYLKSVQRKHKAVLPNEIDGLVTPGYPPDQSVIFHSAYNVARDLWLLDESRVRKLEKYGVRNERLDALHADAYAQLVRAKDALNERRYSEHLQAAHEAWGLEARAYPDVKGTALDTIKGIIFYFALLLPFSLFMERLLLGFSDFRRQIAGVCVMFLLAFVVLRFVHPAFKISDSPYVILLGFIILVLGVIVTLTIALKFRGEVQKMKSEGSGIIETDVGRLSATYSAILLGISNLRKRKVRTTLTATTICLLTFTVLSFTSVVQQLDFWRIPINSDFSPHMGALVRNRDYKVLQPQTYAMLAEAFDGKAQILRRNWVMAPQANPELGYYELINPASQAKAIANAFVGLEPGEAKLPVGYKDAKGNEASGSITRILQPGSRWIAPGEAKKNVILLPAYLANALEITAEQVRAGQARIQFLRETYVVIGIFNENLADAARFLDDEPITPLDLSAAVAQKGQGANPAESGAEQIKVKAHLPSRTVPIVPYEKLESLGHGLRQIAICQFNEPKAAIDQIKNFMRRVSLAVFVGDGKSIQVYSTMGTPKFSGLGKLFIPILIVAALVMNTMLGAVYERFREIGIYSSVGLAPNHIGALFLAESFVFATVGAVIGYLLSQAMAFVLSNSGMLSGINLNYSSLSAVLATLIVMATVLASSIYPARKASQMAVPDVARRWKIEPPTNDCWKFYFPFTVAGRDAAGLNVFLRDYFQAYIDNSVAEFFTQGVRLETLPSSFDGKPIYRLSFNLWLAPYDLSISQVMVMESIPTGQHDLYEVQVTLHRLSGEFNSWIKISHGFLTTLRKRFLLWRTIPPATKEQYALQLTGEVK